MPCWPRGADRGGDGEGIPPQRQDETQPLQHDPGPPAGRQGRTA
jgi:hypothetical protein